MRPSLPVVVRLTCFSNVATRRRSTPKIARNSVQNDCASPCSEVVPAQRGTNWRALARISFQDGGFVRAVAATARPYVRWRARLGRLVSRFCGVPAGVELDGTPGRRIVFTANDPDWENLEGGHAITELPYDAAVVDALHAAVSYTHLRAHETDSYLVCRLLLEK